MQHDENVTFFFNLSYAFKKKNKMVKEMQLGEMSHFCLILFMLTLLYEYYG